MRLFNFNILYESYYGLDQTDSDVDLTITTNLHTDTINERMVAHATALDSPQAHAGFNISQDVSLDVNDPAVEFNATISALPDKIGGLTPKYIAGVLVLTNKEFEG